MRVFERSLSRTQFDPKAGVVPFDLRREPLRLRRGRGRYWSGRRTVESKGRPRPRRCVVETATGDSWLCCRTRGRELAAVLSNPWRWTGSVAWYVLAVDPKAGGRVAGPGQFECPSLRLRPAREYLATAGSGGRGVDGAGGRSSVGRVSGRTTRGPSRAGGGLGRLVPATIRARPRSWYQLPAGSLDGN